MEESLIQASLQGIWQGHWGSPNWAEIGVPVVVSQILIRNSVGCLPGYRRLRFHYRIWLTDRISQSICPRTRLVLQICFCCLGRKPSINRELRLSGHIDTVRCTKIWLILDRRSIYLSKDWNQTVMWLLTHMFWPTLGRSDITLMLKPRSVAAGPTPDTISSCGERN